MTEVNETQVVENTETSETPSKANKKKYVFLTQAQFNTVFGEQTVFGSQTALLNARSDEEILGGIKILEITATVTPKPQKSPSARFVINSERKLGPRAKKDAGSAITTSDSAGSVSTGSTSEPKTTRKRGASNS